MATPPRFDLQSHSTHSDGALPPAEVVERAAAAGVELLALSDHDSIAGVDEAIKASEQLPIRILPAVEITAIDSQHEDIHLLGYALNHHDPLLSERLSEARAERQQRGSRMADLLEADDWAVDRSLLHKVAESGSTVGRPHVAAAVSSVESNSDRLAELGLTDDGKLIGSLLVPGGAGYVPREHPTVEEAIGWVHDADGLAVYAHPFFPPERYDEELIETVLRRYVAAGLDGVECFYTTHDESQTRFLYGLADELGLLTTGSADFHGPEHPNFREFRAFETYDLEPKLGRLGRA